MREQARVAPPNRKPWRSFWKRYRWTIRCCVCLFIGADVTIAALLGYGSDRAIGMGGIVLVLVLAFYITGHGAVGIIMLVHACSLGSPLLHSTYLWHKARRSRTSPESEARPSDKLLSIRRVVGLLIMNSLFHLLSTAMQIWVLALLNSTFGGSLKYAGCCFGSFFTRIGVSYWHVKIVKPSSRKVQVTQVDAPSGPASTLSSRTPAYIYEHSILMPDQSDYDNDYAESSRCNENMEIGVSRPSDEGVSNDGEE